MGHHRTYAWVEKKPLDNQVIIRGFLVLGGDEGIRTLDPGFARMLP